MELKHRYEPLLAYLHQLTPFQYELKIPASYDQLLLWFGQKQIDLALFGGVTFVKAHREYLAVPLVMRSIDTKFRSAIIVKAQDNASTLEQIMGYSFAFGSHLSTSGHYMPRFFLATLNIDPDEYFNDIRYSGTHDKTTAWVVQGKVDAGVVNSQFIYSRLESGKLTRDQIKILWQSPTYVNYVWSVQESMDKQSRKQLRDAFLLLGKNGTHKEILSNLRAKYFLPARIEDFSQLQKALDQYERRVANQ